MFGLSYQEKSLYGSLAAEMIVYFPYFLIHHDNSVNKVAGMIAGIIVLQIVLQSLIAAFTRNRVKDERDRLILLRGYRAGYISLVSFMVVGLGLLWLHNTVGNLDVEHRSMGLHFLSVFFLMLVLSDIVKTVTQLAAYRRTL